MNQQAIFLPLATLFLLTLLAGLRMYTLRIREIFKRDVDLDNYRTRKLAQSLGDQADAASDNFINMFELPVVFYALGISIYVLQLVDGFYLYVAWAFVATRIAHHIIHVTYNRVVHRFFAYIAGFAILLIMVLRFVYQVAF